MSWTKFSIFNSFPCFTFAGSALTSVQADGNLVWLAKCFRRFAKYFFTHPPPPVQMSTRNRNAQFAWEKVCNRNPGAQCRILSILHTLPSQFSSRWALRTRSYLWSRKIGADRDLDYTIVVLRLCRLAVDRPPSAQRLSVTIKAILKCARACQCAFHSLPCWSLATKERGKEMVNARAKKYWMHKAANTVTLLGLIWSGCQNQ